MSYLGLVDILDLSVIECAFTETAEVVADAHKRGLSAGVLLFGAPPRHTEIRCTLGTLACILLYGIVKCFIYLCLIERVHAVWSDRRRRWHSSIYRFCIALIIPLGGIAGFMLYQGIHYLRDGYCILGIKHTASLVFMSYDIALNIFLTFLFVAPLVRSTIRSARLKVIAIRAMVATAIGLVTTIVNGFILFALGGEEIIWVCLGGCAADVVVNAVVIYWAMQSPPRPKESIHFSPLSLNNTTRSTPHNNIVENLPAFETQHKPAIYSSADVSYDRTGHTLSHGTIVTSTVSVPMIDIPQPTMRNPHHVDLYGSHRLGTQLSLPPSTKRAPRSDNIEGANSSLQELGLVQNHANSSKIYGLKVGQASSESY
ncbi:unnamed protein product [Rhizoctonia solani]|uniref:Transmembrane protein n=1 Tax=Rhizoctonia solani TaxID=456999 RepID=A0A8H3BM63_9AGAM|nr:unnamed protein product [Rhizoctonia solani]